MDTKFMAGIKEFQKEQHESIAVVLENLKGRHLTTAMYHEIESLLKQEVHYYMDVNNRLHELDKISFDIVFNKEIPSYPMVKFECKDEFTKDLLAEIFKDCKFL